MSGLEGLFAILIVALMPVALVFVTRYYALREKELFLRTDADTVRLQQLIEDKRHLEARIENLESIVCTIDFDLDQRLHGLTTGFPTSLETAPAPRALLSAASRPARRSQGRNRPRVRRNIAPRQAPAEDTALASATLTSPLLPT